jgi:5-methylcytosine-specific restriction endonuclease McrA
MSWVRFDDQFPIHRRIESLSDPAFRLHVSAICWCARNLTDGRVSLEDLDSAVPKTMKRPEKFVTELVRRGAWIKHPWGWEIHDYLEYQFSKEKVLKERKRNARRTALHRDTEVINAVRLRDGDICRYCGQTVNWSDRRSPDGGTYDHIDPDGPNSLENLAVACRGCNSRKHNRTPEQAGMPLRPAAGGEVLNTNLARNKNFSGPVPDPNPTREEIKTSRPARAAPRRPTTSSTAGPEFEEFYATYPRHVGRKAAEKAWLKAIKDGADAPEILAGAKRYADERRGQDPRFTKYPASWLNGGHWEDEPQRKQRENTVSENDDRIAQFLRGSGAPRRPEPSRRQLPPGEAS